ncbi:aKG-HExxH-type peptide beta-hydroxylase [Streptomyces sp. NPDC085481]|uniref:aKG-HExxH-type peptide beta-hydroxylase n=1 Tax=Streptomyces sp. NPDC085481 TaxID=3365727 RepID=UPI0037D76C70
MTPGPLSEAAFSQLARTRPDTAGGPLLHSAARARRRLLLKALRTRVERRRDDLHPELYERFDASWRLMERAELHRPAPVHRVIDYPTTGTWLVAALAAPPGASFDALLAHWDAIAATAALRAGCPLDREVAAPHGRLALTGAGRLRVGAERARIRFRGRTAGIGPADARFPRTVLLTAGARAGRIRGFGHRWSALRTLPGGTAVLDDLDPYRVPPGGIGGRGRPAAERAADAFPLWAARWRAAHELLARTDPGRAAEALRAVRVVVPLVSDGRHTGAVGATLSAAPGAVLTTLPRGPRELAETLVHEVHHGKLAALHDLVPLYRSGGAAVHRVGWRPDARPVSGVYQGVYAHLALTDLWRRAATGGGLPAPWRTAAGQQFERFHDQVGEALEILLQSDELTSAGREFADRMRRHHASLGTTRGALG